MEDKLQMAVADLEYRMAKVESLMHTVQENNEEFLVNTARLTGKIKAEIAHCRFLVDQIEECRTAMGLTNAIL